MNKKKSSKTLVGRFKSIRSAMMVSFSIVIVVALVVFILTAVSYTENTVLSNSILYSRQTINQLNGEIDSYINYMENIASIIANNDDVQTYLFSGQEEEFLVDERERILSQFAVIKESRDDITNIATVSLDGKNLVNDGKEGISEYVNLQEMEWFQNAISAEGGISISPSHVQNAISSSYKWVITMSRTLINLKTGKVEGLFFIDLNYESISDLCNSNNIGQRGYTFILDNNGSMIYHPQQQLIYGGLKTERIDDLLQEESEFLITKEGEGSRLYTMSKSEKTGWTVVGTAYTSELLSQTENTQRLYVVISVLLIIAVIIISNLISKAITKPITTLRNSMSMIEKGEFQKANIQVKDDNELGGLSRSFNVMTAKIEELMKQNISVQKQKRKSELRALQAQINPHFLYNTLDSIIWMSAAGKNDDVVEMTSALAKLFRQSISNEEEQILIKQEIEHVKSYLTIQKMRYKDKMDYFIQVDESIMNMSIIKLVLQPLVENAIYHGLKYRESKGELYVIGERCGDEIRLRIIDNGVGMTEEELGKVFEEKESSYKSNGVAVINIQKRLQLYYGTKYGIKFQSEKGKGTTATIIIPVERGEGDEEEV